MTTPTTIGSEPPWETTEGDETAMSDNETTTETTETTEENTGVAPGDEVDETEVDETEDTDDTSEMLSYEQLLADRDEWKAQVEKLEATDKGTLSKEAAGYRAKLREAERERDDARALLNATRERVVLAELVRNQLDPRLLAAAGHTFDEFVSEDGQIDLDKVVSTTARLAIEFGTNQPRKPQPNPLAGRATTDNTTPSGRAAWNAAFGVGQR